MNDCGLAAKGDPMGGGENPRREFLGMKSAMAAPLTEDQQLKK
ncbi:MAG TPA: hypothetical protein VMV89_11130 [Candidatus Paceibacterota bacterium]|nr:hypothetical protein [Candidatus Paceibacterota bacterium]